MDSSLCSKKAYLPMRKPIYDLHVIRNSILYVSIILATIMPHEVLAVSADSWDGDPQTTPPTPVQKPPSNTAPTELTGVTVSGASYDVRRDDTTSKIVVTQTDLLRFGDTTLADALRRLPGVTVGTGVPGKSGAVSLRGMGSGYTQVLLNGQKVPLGFDLESLTPEVVDRVEIVRAATADMRTEAIAGTINIVLKKSASSRNDSVKLSSSSSRGIYTPGISWQMSNADERLSYALNASVAQRNYLLTETNLETGVDAAGKQDLFRPGSSRMRGRNDILSASPSASYKLDSGDKLSIETFVDASDSTATSDIRSRTLVGDEQAHPTDYQYSEFKAVQMRADMGWTHAFAKAGQIETKLTLNLDRTDGDFREHGYDADNTLNLDTRVDSQVRGSGFNSTGKYSLPYVENHLLELGWDGGIKYRDESRVQTGRVVSGVDPGNSSLSFDARVARLGLYAQDDWTVTPSWSLYYGLRIENLNTRSSGNDFESVSYSGKVVSPLIQALWKIPGAKKDQVRLAFSRTYNAPPIASLVPRPYTTTNNTPLNPDTVGNPALKPELAVGIDLAFEHYWKDDAMISVGPYARRIDDVIRNDVRLVDNRWVASPFNGGNAAAWGVEMDTHFTLDEIIDGAPQLNVRFNAARNWSDVDEVPGPNNRINDQIRFSSTLEADYRFSPDWSAGSSYSFKTGGPVRIATNQLDGSAARRVLDLYALWNISKDASLRLSVANLLRQDFVTSTEYFDANGSMRNVEQQPSQATVRADIEIKY
jgi:outer membrane receptor for ferrienterochelin and colicins